MVRIKGQKHNPYIEGKGKDPNEFFKNLLEGIKK